jgi:hypothetical protein
VNTPRWRKMGTAYRLQDNLSTLWIKRIDRTFHLLNRSTNGREKVWLTLGTYSTLREAQQRGDELMEITRPVQEETP